MTGKKFGNFFITAKLFASRINTIILITIYTYIASCCYKFVVGNNIIKKTNK